MNPEDYDNIEDSLIEDDDDWYEEEDEETRWMDSDERERYEFNQRANGRGDYEPYLDEDRPRWIPEDTSHLTPKEWQEKLKADVEEFWRTAPF